MARTWRVLEDFLGPFSKGCFCTLNQTRHKLALLRWRTHKLICLLFLTLGGKMWPEYTKSTPSHACFASVPPNNLHLSSYMALLGGRLCQFNPSGKGENSIQRASFLVECWDVCGHCISPQLQLERKQPQHFGRLCQHVSDPTGAWQRNAFFSHLHQV